MRIRIYPYRGGSASARALATALGARVIRRTASRWHPRRSDVVVNWGYAGMELADMAYDHVGFRLLNDPGAVIDARDKLRTLSLLRAAGVPTVHYVSPSIRVWRPKRIEKIRRAADRVLLVFPFEQKIYDEAGIAATYVGHPLASIIPAQPDARAARARLGFGAEEQVIALLPGSRRAEVEHIGPAFVEAALLMLRRAVRRSA